MKKTLLTLLSLILLTQTGFSAGIGYIDYYKVVTTYPLAQKYRKELLNKSNAINNYTKNQENKILQAKDKETKNQLRDKGIAEIKKMQKDYAILREQREQEIQNKIKLTADKVKEQKKLDIIIKKDASVTGGIDVTQDVINGLK